MSIRSVEGTGWTRVFVDGVADLVEAERALGIEMRRGAGGPERAAFPLRLVESREGTIQVHEVTVVLREDRIVTVEPSGGAPLLQDVEARLRLDADTAASPHGVCFRIVEAGCAGLARALSRIESDFRAVSEPLAALEPAGANGRTIGVSDLPRVSALLADIDDAISHASYAAGRLTQLARLLRQGAPARAGIPRGRLDDLVLRGEALGRHLEFVVDRHRFHAQGAAQKVSTSDLNVVKVFSVLWAIFIPGTTLINWYGQNFEVMPELSWPYTSWVQIAGVFLMAALPIAVIKRAGQLR